MDLKVMSSGREDLDERAHTRAQVLSFWFRSSCLRIAHLLRSGVKRPARLKPDAAATGAFTEVVGMSASELYAGEGISATERAWQLGKVENLRIALRGIDGVFVPAGAIFSFWRQVGPPWRVRGFTTGRELREGCLIPNVGGGLCQLSNALYDCALKSGCEIIERHRHTRVVPGSLAEINRDATVFWNYVDLRFRARQPLQISAKLTARRLEVTFRAAGVAPAPGDEARKVASGSKAVENCATCGIESCMRHVGPGAAMEETAVLVDEFWPEFDAWLSVQKRDRWRLAVPMRRSRWARANYAWNDLGWHSVRDVPLLALLRAWQSRRLAAQGATRQRALLAFDRQLSGAFASRLSWRCSRVVVTQTLLPYLHASGWLGGRSVTVLLTRLPIRMLQQRLDEAARRHPASRTLADFRADSALAEAEWEALESAEALVTCHSQLARIWPGKTTLLPWKIPAPRAAIRPSEGEPLVVFPASGVARKGAFELREAMRELGLPLRVAGTEQLEKDPGFWSGVRLAAPTSDWLENARVVVLPSWVEHRPRRLLEAIAAGIPVVASEACGLHGWPAEAPVSIVPCGDAAALIREIKKAMAGAAVTGVP